MIDFSLITDVATLGFVIRGVWIMSSLNTKVKTLEKRIEKIETVETFKLKNKYT